MTGSLMRRVLRFWIDGQPKPKNQNEMNWVIDYIVDPDYLRVMQMPLFGAGFSRPAMMSILRWSPG
jgi:hypothetical protein